MLKKNKVLQLLSDNQPALGGWVFSDSVVCAEIMAASGFSWVCIDAEHTQVSKETAVDMVRAIESHGAEPFVRVCVNGESEIKRYLDMGVRGVIVPMVKSLDDVRRTISYIHFPPVGSRSYSLSRATGYGENKEEYFSRANDEIFLGVMIEHVDALGDLDAIFSCREIDVVFVGPYDLSGSMGFPGDFERAEFRDAMALITQKATEHHVTMGFHEVHPTSEKIKSLLDSGVRFIACGMDTVFIAERSKEFARFDVSDYIKQR